MTPLGLARKISTAFRVLGYKTEVGRWGPRGGNEGNFVRVLKKHGRGNWDEQLGLVTVETRNGELVSYVEHDSDHELHDAYRALTAR